MKFAIFLTMKPVVIGCLCVGTLTAVSCAGGGGVLTSPSANPAVSSLVATAPANGESRPRATAPSSKSSPIRDLSLTKTCDVTNLPTELNCTVVTSENGPLPVGTRADYDVKVFDVGCQKEPATPGCDRMSGNVVLTTPGAGGTAAGHCTLSFKTGSGTCTFARGTGVLIGFHANVKVTFDFTTGVTTWDGTYHFSGGD